jgi:hypothetical protein
MFQHIVPALLQRVYSKDNNREQFLYSMGQSGSVGGDVFVKVAYAQAGTAAADPTTGRGRVALLVLQPSHCFPTWDPHVPGKMTNFKLKYKFFNHAGDGTKYVSTYCEEITTDSIKEWVDDNLIRDTPNPLGIIPVVHIANFPITGSPWGLSDIDSIIPLNREYNEKATDVSDIINYHVAPVTVVIGGKPGGLEKGPAKIWGLPNEKGQIYNLEGGAAGLPVAMEYLELLRMRMHEYGHVPANALGEPQPVSNTSGVALAIQYMPTMQYVGLKHIQYGTGLIEISRLILRTLFWAEPESVLYDEGTEGILDPNLGQQPELDPADPQVYDINVDWPSPFPVDTLIKLEEIERKMGLRLESRKGALQTLGEEFPDEKAAELREELMRDAKWDAELTVFKAQVAAAVMALTGVIPPDAGEPVAPEPPQDGNTAANSNAPQQVTARQPEMPPGLQVMQQQIINEIVTNAFMPRTAFRRNVDVNDSDPDSSVS